MKTGLRAGEQIQFSMPGERAILVATSAFAIGAAACENDTEGVPLRYGRRTTKADIRALVRLSPPTSLEQLADELSLLGRDGKPAEGLVFFSPGDHLALEAEVQDARPTGEQLLMFGRALEESSDDEVVTTESLATKARSSRRSVETLAALLEGMGLVSNRDGWLRRLVPNHVVLGELRALAERLATVRALDARRLVDVGGLASYTGCKTARLRQFLGETDTPPCGACRACAGSVATDGSYTGQRRDPARRFTVQTAEATTEARQNTFHSDRRTGSSAALTAKLADFR